MVAELRNDSSVVMNIGKVRFYFYDASGQVVCKRWSYAFDDILYPGSIKVVKETVPSFMYWTDETKNFPEDWATYEITLSAEPYQPVEGQARPVDVTVQDVEVTVTITGGLDVTGNVFNSSQETVKQVTPYAILYASDGTILNALSQLLSIELQPGQGEPFEIKFSAQEPVDYDHYVVKAYAEKF